MPFHEEGWDRYHRLKRRFLMVWLAGVPGTFLVGFICSHYLPGRAGEIVQAIFVALWLLTFVATLGQLETFRCPRCGNRFSIKGLAQYSVLNKNCVHCGLTKFGMR